MTRFVYNGKGYGHRVSDEAFSRFKEIEIINATGWTLQEMRSQPLSLLEDLWDYIQAKRNANS